MKQEVIATGKTIEVAVASGADEIGVDSSKCTYEVLEQPKKGLLGIGQTPAKVKVIYELTPEQSAINLVNTIIKDMDLAADTELAEGDGERCSFKININGEDAHKLIGYHGDTLDSLQYLVNLSCMKRNSEENSEDNMHICIDIEGYRAKREVTLRQLAKRMAEKVLKYKKSISLEPMNAYERRIIHSEVQLIEGVSTTSVGSGNNRRVVVFIPGMKDVRGSRSGSRRPRPQDFEVKDTYSDKEYDNSDIDYSDEATEEDE